MVIGQENGRKRRCCFYKVLTRLLLTTLVLAGTTRTAQAKRGPGEFATGGEYYIIVILIKAPKNESPH
jgi:hypothetical protein